jgi:hypothetical protein
MAVINIIPIQDFANWIAELDFRQGRPDVVTH